MKYSNKNIARNIFALCRPTYDSPAEQQEEYKEDLKIKEKYKHFEEFMTLDEYENVRKHYGVKKYVHKD